MLKLKILVIDDEQLICWSFQQQLQSDGYTVFTAETGESGVQLFEKHTPDIVFLDNRLPGMQGLDVLQKILSIKDDAFVVFMTAFGTIETAVQAMKLGAVDYLNKPFSFDEIDVLLDSIKNKIELQNELAVLRRDQEKKTTLSSIIGESPEMSKIVSLARKIAISKASTILLLGDSGTGKDLLARSIHNESNRKKKPFVTINCASLPETLLESELFGHEKGAYTDAKKQKKGLFEIADGGTVFLDEIGEIDMALQVKLLGIIENREFRRLGGTEDLNVDIRIIAATNQDLQQAIENKIFREDLYYRLKVFQLTLPTLKQRMQDIPELIRHFIAGFNQQFHKAIKGMTAEAEQLLMQYSWPGNVRELRNVIERAIILETEQLIGVENLPVEITNLTPARNIEEVNHWFNIPDSGFSLYDIEKKIIHKTLVEAKFNQTRAAEMMGITRDTLRYKIKKYNLGNVSG